MSPAEAIEKENVIATHSKSQNGPLGFDEKNLPCGILVRYLLDSSDLEGWRRRAGDMIWSPQVYHIRESLVQKNQPVLYWIENVNSNGPERSFVREELMVIPADTDLPPQWVLDG